MYLICDFSKMYIGDIYILWEIKERVFIDI